jgi:small-conductance mechanosensitive channel
MKPFPKISTGEEGPSKRASVMIAHGFGKTLRVVLLFALTLPVGSWRVQAQAQKAPAQPAPSTQTNQNAGSPVMVEGKPVLYIRAGYLTFTPQDRANLVAKKVRDLIADSKARAAAITTVDAETTTAIMSDETVILTVTDRDAAAAGLSRQQLAADDAQKIQSAIQSARHEHSLRTILFGALWTVLATFGLILALKLFVIIFPKIYSLLQRWHGKYIHSVRIQKLELIPAERITVSLVLLTRGLRLVLTLILLYFYASLVFSFFPWTRGYASVLWGYVLYPLRTVGAGFAAYLPNVFFIAVILVVAYYAVKLVKFFFLEIGKGTISLPGFYTDWAQPTYKITRFLIIVFTAIVIFPYMPGSKSPAFQGISIFVGLLVSLGSSSAVSNVVAGILLTYTRGFQLGDRVQIGDTTGDVIEKTLLVTRIQTIKNVDISIPNALVLTSHIINYSSSARQFGLILHTTISIGYDAPWRKVHELLIDAAESTPNILKDPKPFVLQTSLGDFYVSYQINAFTDQPNLMAGTYSELHKNIQEKFNEAGVEIMSPHFTSVRDGNRTAIPQDHLPKDYQPRSFRVDLPQAPRREEP